MNERASSVLLLAVAAALVGWFGYSLAMSKPAAPAPRHGLEFLDAEGLLRRVSFTEFETRAEVDVGPADGLDRVESSLYIERNDTPGRQPDEPPHSSSSVGVGAEVERDHWHELTTGFGRHEVFDLRRSFEVGVTTTGGVEQVDHFGPGIVLTLGAPVKWRLLWSRRDGPILSWRDVGGRLELRLADAAGAALTVVRGESTYESDGGSDGGPDGGPDGELVVRVPIVELGTDRRLRIRCTIRLVATPRAVAIELEPI